MSHDQSLATGTVTEEAVVTNTRRYGVATSDSSNASVERTVTNVDGHPCVKIMLVQKGLRIEVKAKSRETIKPVTYISTGSR